MTELLVDPKAPLPRPEWVDQINAEGRMWKAAGMLSDMVPLDKDSLIAAARLETGLFDLGDADWEEPLDVLLRALDEEAELNLMGRLASRSEIILLLRNRLKITELVRRHPEIREQPIVAPIIITGLPRTGTSIMQELLNLDPRLRTPLFWETYFMGEAAESGGDDPFHRKLGDEIARQWIRITPQIATMHETAGHIPAEDATLWNFSFVSDAIMSFYQIPSYHAWVNRADPMLIYKYHRLALQALQWKQPGRRWFGKTLYHLGCLPKLFEAYPDARVIHTHRDPLRSMASIANLLRTFYWQRSDRDFDSPGFEEIMVGKATADRLEQAMAWRKAGAVPDDHFVDSRYQDLMEDPINAMRKVYQGIGLSFDAAAASRVTDYLAYKPKHKLGTHRYRTMSPDQIARNRPYFEHYQRQFGVPDEI
ncbi:Sulfotransferase family protein [Sphingomonas laterariae]|uniref:Sulfotransferase family protein n=1 Tax=Edaphosphingomonas laterariae TaxID=861865 RepID=A0A239I2M0_9SPHN|nr:sulfotransferase [Sphingomonas laterariae]SNS87769.1 Sulfotransferase family protein [Sphingomonas laterariae]